MSSKRFLIVPEDSSAASRPLPGTTMVRAILLSSARFIDAFSESTVSLHVKVDGSQAIPKKTLKNKSKKTPEKHDEKHDEKRQEPRNAAKNRAGAGEGRSGLSARHATFGSSSPLL